MQKYHICKVRVVKSVDDPDESNESIDNISEKLENITLDIEPIKQEEISYDNHYITIVMILCPQTYSNIVDPDKIYFIANHILCKEDSVLPSYKIDYVPGYKFKKYVRDKVVSSFGFKNKDIHTIKNINTNKNNHNYLVFLKDSKRNNQYEYASFSNKSKEYMWYSTLEMYTPYRTNPSQYEIYTDLSLGKLLERHLCNEDKTNIIERREIYRTIGCI